MHCLIGASQKPDTQEGAGPQMEFPVAAWGLISNTEALRGEWPGAGLHISRNCVSWPIPLVLMIDS